MTQIGRGIESTYDLHIALADAEGAKKFKAERVLEYLEH